MSKITYTEIYKKMLQSFQTLMYVTDICKNTKLFFVLLCDSRHCVPCCFTFSALSYFVFVSESPSVLSYLSAGLARIGRRQSRYDLTYL